MAPSRDELRQMLSAFRRSFVWAGVFSAFINLLMLVPPLYMLQLYDRVLTSQSSETLLALTLIVVGLFIVMGLLQFVRSRLLVRVGARLDRSLNGRVFHAMYQGQLQDPGNSSAQPISDLTTLRQFLTGQGLIAFFDAPWMVIFIGVLFLFHLWLGLFGVFAALVLLILTLVNEYATRRPQGEASREQVRSRDFADHNLRNAEVLHAMGMEPNVRRHWLQRHGGFLVQQAAASDRSGVWSTTSQTLRLMFQSLILGLGAWLAINGQISPGMMIAGSIILGRALAPVDKLTGSWQGFTAARSAYARLRALLAAAPPDERNLSLPAPAGRVAFEALFAAPPGARTPVLRGINFSVEPGEAVGVIGPSAAGKSSLARVLLGVWPALSGAVRLDGADITQWNRDELGPYLGYLPQDIELFEGTVAENIARMGAVDDEQVVAAAQVAGVHEMILQLPEGYETKVGTGGGILSAGQRQRVALARAIYGNPAVVVLDEPNSNLDDQGEAALLEALGTLRQRGTTLFLITHDMNLLAQLDKILLLQDGEARLYGPAGEVLAKLTGKQGSSQQRQVRKSGQPQVSLRAPRGN